MPDKAMEAMKEMMADLEKGIKPKPARRTTFDRNYDGSLTRRIYDAENRVVSTTILSVEEQLAYRSYTNGSL